MATKRFSMFLSVVFTCLFGLSLSKSNAKSVNLSRGGTRLTGPEGLRATLLKHGRYVWPELEAAAKDHSILVDAYKSQLSATELAKLQSGSTPATGDPNQGFTAPFTIGKSELDLLIDTGSSDLWVYSDLLPKNDTKGHKLYDPSSGTLLANYTWKILYGDGDRAAGIVYQDSVQVGAATATSQAIEVATSITGGNAYGPSADGIVGLAFEKLNQVKPKKQPPLWETLDPTLKEKIFAVDFHDHASSGGTLDFGDIDSSKYKGNITYVPVTNPDGFWFFDFTEFIFNNNQTYAALGYNHSSPKGLIDTGTTYLVIDRIAAGMYYSNIQGAKLVAGTWIFPCNSKVVSLGIKIAGVYFYVYPEFVKQPLKGLDYICFGGIQPALGLFSKYDYGDIIGDPFIVGNYIVFDGENKRIGFAPQIGV